MTTALPILPRDVLNIIFQDYAQMYKQSWIPVMDKKDKIQFKVNLDSKKYQKISEVLVHKKNNPPVTHVLMLNNEYYADAYTFCIANNVFGHVIYSTYEKYRDEYYKNAYIYMNFQNISTRSYFKMGSLFENNIYKMNDYCQHNIDIRWWNNSPNVIDNFDENLMMFIQHVDDYDSLGGGIMMWDNED